MELKKIIPPKVDLYSPTDEFMGKVNEYEFDDFCRQIKLNNASGYYIIHGNQKCPIYTNGSIRYRGLIFSLNKEHKKLFYRY